MEGKQIIFNSEARKKLKLGVDLLANAVKVTLGPKGRTVIIEEGTTPHITKDGVTVAKSVVLSDPMLNLGAQLVKSVSAKTGTDAGDGTTTATVLAQAMINIGLKNIEAGANPLDIKRGIDKAVSVITGYIKDVAIKVDYDKIEQIATISANNDPEIGKLIADTMRKVTLNGVITLEESKTTETITKVIEGIQFDCGFISPYFVTDSERMNVSLTNAEILILNDKLNNFRPIYPLIDSCVNSCKQCLIIANDVDEDVLNTLVANRVNTNAKFCVVKAPYFGERRKNFLLDLAITTGGKVVNSLNDIILPKNLNSVLGYAQKVNITKNSTTIINDSRNDQTIAIYLKELEKQMAALPDGPDKSDLQERIDNLKGGIAVIYVGANSEVELLEKKDRLDDALCAIRAAIEEGIVPGGGLTYLRSLEYIKDFEEQDLSQDERTGVNIVKEAVKVPLKQICLNAGVSGDVIISDIMHTLPDSIGYNAKKGESEDLLKAGVIDPAKVARVALENAASVAGTFLTTECAIAHIDNN